MGKAMKREIRQCSSCGGFCKKSGCERENVPIITSSDVIAGLQMALSQAEAMIERQQHVMQRAMDAWDSTTLQKNGDGRLWQCMEELRAESHNARDDAASVAQIAVDQTVMPVTAKGSTMKLDIEITEAEIKAAIERKIRVAIADESNSWSADNFIKAAVKKHWAESVDRVVQECLADTPRIQEKIKAAIEAKLKGQLTAMMKVKA